MSIDIETSTAQEVADYVRNHLLTQKARSVNDGQCRYQSEAGLMCAAGCLIPDNKYSEEMEDVLWRDLVARELVPNAHCRLIGHLQSCHDDNPVEHWPKILKSIYKVFDLTW